MLYTYFLFNFLQNSSRTSVLGDGGRTVLVGDVKGGMNIQVGNGNRMDIINCHDGRPHPKPRVNHSQITSKVNTHSLFFGFISPNA